MCSCVLLFFFFSTCDVGGSTYIRVDQQSCKYGTKSIVPLVAPVSATELWVAIKGANVASTPGPDGIPAAFYREFSPVVREPLLNMVNG